MPSSNYPETLRQLERLLKVRADEDGVANLILYENELVILRRLVNNEIQEVAVEFYLVNKAEEIPDESP